jgi:hypothetical protein
MILEGLLKGKDAVTWFTALSGWLNNWVTGPAAIFGAPPLFKRLIITVILICGLAACAGSPEIQELRAYEAPILESPASFRAFLSGATTVSQDPNSFPRGHGTQASYHRDDGTVFLWYPGNRSVVVGEWKTEVDRNGQVVNCYKYGPSSYNPVTRERGGTWSCWRPLLNGRIMVVDGNPYGIRHGPVPAVIPDRNNYFAEHLMRFVGRNPVDLSFRWRVPYAERLERQIAQETGTPFPRP